MTRRRRRDGALALGVTVAAMAVTGFHRLVAGDLVFSRDTTRLLYPLKVYVVSRLRAGHLPLWYPYASLGTPCLAAGVTGVYHPLTWLAVVVGPLAGHALATLACLGLVAWGTWRLARRLGADRAGAAVATVVAASGGSLVSTLDNQTFLWGVTAFPFFLLGVVGAVRRRDPVPGVLLAAGALAWSALAGDFQAVYVCALAGIPLALLLHKGPWPRALGRVAAAGAVGATLSAVQLLPSLAALRHIDRAHGLPWSVATRWSLHPLRLPELFLGDLLRYRQQGTGPDVRALVVASAHAPWQLTVFLGAVPLVGLVWVVASRRRRVPGALLLVAGLLLWLALGRHGGLYRLAYAVLPVWDAFRYPEKLLPFVQILLAVVTGLAVTRAWRRPRHAARLALFTALALAGVALALALAAAGASALLAPWLGRARTGALAGAWVAAVLGLAFHLRARGTIPRLAPALAAIPALLALVQLAPVDARLLAMMTGPPSLLTGPSVGAELLRRHGLDRPGRARTTTWSGTAIGLTVHDPDPDVAGGFAGRARWNRDALAPDTSGLFGVETTGHYLPVVTPRYRRVVSGRPRAWLTRDAAIFNGRFGLLDRPSYQAVGRPWGRVLLDDRDLALVVVEDPRALPRAFVTTPRFVSGATAAEAALATPELAAGRVAVVEGPPVPAYAGHPAAAGPGPATVIRYRPEEVMVEATAPAPSVLVLNDAFFPGWRARLDGRPVPIRRANDLVRGVLLPQGRHRVVFTYPASPALVTGGVTSALALLGVLVVAGGRRRRAR